MFKSFWQFLGDNDGEAPASSSRGRSRVALPEQGSKQALRHFCSAFVVQPWLVFGWSGQLCEIPGQSH